MSNNEQAAFDPELPLWFRILNIEDTQFEKTKYSSLDGEKFRLKDLNILRKLSPGLYEDAAGSVKEYSDALFETQGTFRKYKLGRKLGSIPIIDMALHPELNYDNKAQDKYFEDHPELKVKKAR